MNDEEPHAVTDEEPSGEVSKTHVVTKATKKKKIIVTVDFDDFLKEFELWNHIYDLRDTIEESIEFECNPDYKNRIQYYEITAGNKIINKMRLWLMRNNFKYKLDK